MNNSEENLISLLENLKNAALNIPKDGYEVYLEPYKQLMAHSESKYVLPQWLLGDYLDQGHSFWRVMTKKTKDYIESRDGEGAWVTICNEGDKVKYSFMYETIEREFQDIKISLLTT